MNRTLADSLVALGIFVASLVVGAAVLVGGLMLAARTLGNHADPTANSSAADFLVVRGALSCDSEVTEVPEPVMDGEPSALLICADAQGSTPADDLTRDLQQRRGDEPRGVRLPAQRACRRRVRGRVPLRGVGGADGTTGRAA